MAGILEGVASYVSECATGANGELTGREVVERVASRSDLCCWCPEYLAEHDIELDSETLAVVCQMVARAMLSQQKYEMEIWGKVVFDLAHDKPLPAQLGTRSYERSWHDKRP